MVPDGSGGYVGADDVAEVCVRLADSDVRDARFVLCAEHRTHQEVMGLIADACPRLRVRCGVGWRGGWRLVRATNLTGRRSMISEKLGERQGTPALRRHACLWTLPRWAKRGHTPFQRSLLRQRRHA